MVPTDSFKFWKHVPPARLDSHAAVALRNDRSNCTLPLTTSEFALLEFLVPGLWQE